MENILDRPIWTALTTRQSEFGAGASLARRFRPEFLPFAVTLNDGPDALAELASLTAPGETLVFLQADPVQPLPGFEVTMTAQGVQMVAQDVPVSPIDPDIVQLGPDDAAEMLELATLTKPGPFSMKSQMLGRFWGVRIEGRIAAMAGQRMRQPGFVELSGVCTHPDFRGKGLARRLSEHVAARIVDGGDRPYLHAFAANDAAIRLYRTIGFTLRSDMHVAAMRKKGP